MFTQPRLLYFSRDKGYSTCTVFKSRHSDTPRKTSMKNTRTSFENLSTNSLHQHPLPKAVSVTGLFMEIA